MRGYWLSKNWAQHLRRYYEQSRAKLLSPSQKGTPIRRRSRSNSGEALPLWPDANAEILCEHGFLCLGRVLDLAPKGCWSLETWRAIQGRFLLSTKFKASTAAECLSVRSCVETVPRCLRLLDGVAMAAHRTHCLICAQVCSASRTARKLERWSAAAGRRAAERLREVDECSATGGRNPRNRSRRPCSAGARLLRY